MRFYNNPKTGKLYIVYSFNKEICKFYLVKHYLGTSLFVYISNKFSNTSNLNI
jgi:hypothetical protein